VNSSFLLVYSRESCTAQPLDSWHHFYYSIDHVVWGPRQWQTEISSSCLQLWTSKIIIYRKALDSFYLQRTISKSFKHYLSYFVLKIPLVAEICNVAWKNLTSITKMHRMSHLKLELDKTTASVGEVWSHDFNKMFIRMIAIRLIFQQFQWYNWPSWTYSSLSEYRHAYNVKLLNWLILCD